MCISPVLPKNKIKKCIIGEKYRDEINELTEFGIECVTLSPSTCLDDEINSHADILCFNCGNNTLIASSESTGELKRKLPDCNVIACENVCSPYPDDVKLNVAYTGRGVVCNKNYAADEIKTFCEENNIPVIHTNQGYSKCSLAVLSKDAVITEDSGLACLLKKYQFDVLEVQKGFIELSDRHYGFIGGAVGMISENQLYVSGNLTEHPDYDKIQLFLDKYNIVPLFNKNRRLNDFGGFIPV